MKVKELILLLQEASNSDDLEVFICKETELIGGKCAECSENIAIDKIRDRVILIPIGKKEMIYDPETIE